MSGGASLCGAFDLIVLNCNDLPLSIAAEPCISPHKAAPLLLTLRQCNGLGLGAVNNCHIESKETYISFI